ncbi:MAG: hypothetical protein ACXQTR_00935 [Candidatus Methanospirareceae archaeon]
MAEARVVRILPPEEWKKRQLETLRSVGRQNYMQGISMPKKDPIEAGIAAQSRYEEQMRKEEVLKRREAALRATNMSEWYAYASEIGAERLVDGVIKREKKVDRFIKAWQPILADHVATIDALPDVTDADRENRMIENLRGLKAKKGAWR